MNANYIFSAENVNFDQILLASFISIIK